MSTFVLMELCKQSGVKNVIYQLLAPNITINLDEVEENRSYAVVIDKGIRYCLTGNPGIYDEEAPYVLLTDRTPTKQKLIDNDIRQRKWIKHPNQIEASPDDVINSWENRFHFKLEENEENHGLRRPQLGALHALLSHMLAPTEAATVVLPTGTGKTETMLSALVAGRCNRVLVTVPTNALRVNIVLNKS